MYHMVLATLDLVEQQTFLNNVLQTLLFEDLGLLFAVIAVGGRTTTTTRGRSSSSMVSAAAHARQLSGLEASTSCRCTVHPLGCPVRSPVILQRQQHVSSPHLRQSCVAAAAAQGPSAPQKQKQAQQQRLDLPMGDFSRVRKSVFIGSSVDLKGCPPQDYPEFAVIGRSNVGKSSLINMLTQNSKLAKVSKEPGGQCCCSCWH
jgi:hypothetical protein